MSTLLVFEVTNEHDAVYALLAIARDTVPQANDRDSNDETLAKIQEALEYFTQIKRYKVDYQEPFADICQTFVAFCIQKSKDSTRALDIICRPWAPAARRSISSPLPTWVSSLSGAAHIVLPRAGTYAITVRRNNADPLVGQPPSDQALERNYNAAKTKGVDRKSLRFKRRSDTGQWSLHVQGFKLAQVAETNDASQVGGIPSDWAYTGGWSYPFDEDPPNRFWRTLVANRGHNGKNPPVYYSRACKDSFDKGGWAAGSINLSELIHKERHSIITQFRRRVQAVIWNRYLITTEAKRHGFSGKVVKAGDLIYILYGCNVPVALRRQWKTKEDVMQACNDDLNSLIERIRTTFEEAFSERKARRKEKQETQRRFRQWEQQMRWQFRCGPGGNPTAKSRGTSSNPKETVPDDSCQQVGESLQQGSSVEDEQGEQNILPPAQGNPNATAEDPMTFREKEDGFMNLATRREFAAWLKERRLKGQLTKKEIEIREKYKFDFRLKWFREWKRCQNLKRCQEWKEFQEWKKKKAQKESGQKGKTIPSQEPKIDIRLTDDAYIRRHRDRFLKPYKVDKDAEELEKPDSKPAN